MKLLNIRDDIRVVTIEATKEEAYAVACIADSDNSKANCIDLTVRILSEDDLRDLAIMFAPVSENSGFGIKPICLAFHYTKPDGSGYVYALENRLPMHIKRVDDQNGCTAVEMTVLENRWNF